MSHNCFCWLVECWLQITYLCMLMYFLSIVDIWVTPSPMLVNIVYGCPTSNPSHWPDISVHVLLETFWPYHPLIFDYVLYKKCNYKTWKIPFWVNNWQCFLRSVLAQLVLTGHEKWNRRVVARYIKIGIQKWLEKSEWDTLVPQKSRRIACYFK